MDNLINSITSTSDSGITLTLSMAIVAMAAALIFGLVISLTYMGTHKNKYQQSFAITLTMLPIILTVIILFVEVTWREHFLLREHCQLFVSVRHPAIRRI